MIPHGQTIVEGFELSRDCLSQYPLTPYWSDQAVQLGFGETDEAVDQLARFIITTPYQLTLPPKKGKEPQLVQWVPGHPADRSSYGPRRHHEVMVIGKMPYDSDGLIFKFNLTTEAGQMFLTQCRAAGLDTRDWYFTNAVKFNSESGDIDKGQLNACIPFLMQELYIIRPKYILLLGSDAVKAVLGDKATLGQVRSQPIEVNKADLRQLRYTPMATQETLAEGDLAVASGWTSFKAFATIHPASVLREAGMQFGLEKDLRTFKTVMENSFNTQYDLATRYDIRKVTTSQELGAIVDEVIASKAIDLSVDCEWAGEDYMSGRLRSMQFAWTADSACVAIFDHQGGRPAQDEFERIRMMSELRRLLKRPNICVIGHNLRADAKWAHAEQIPLLDGLFWDTMLCDHMLYENAEHGLEACAIKYTDMGRYDYHMAKWVKDNQADIKVNGFKNAPDLLLYDYAGCDVIAPWRIKQRQVHELNLPENSFVKACYNTVVLPCNLPLNEIETTGLLVDFPLMRRMIQGYDAVRIELLTKLRTLIGNNDFNPNSTAQVQDILFNMTWEQLCSMWDRFMAGTGLTAYEMLHWNRLFPDDPAAAVDSLPLQAELMKPAAERTHPGRFELVTVKYRVGLGLKPYKTTGKPSRQWDELNQDSIQILKSASPSTDAETLSEMADASPICTTLRDFKIISQVTKAFLRVPEEDGESPDDYTTGLAGAIDRDGRIRTTLSQMSETGRQKSSRPNLQNLPKKTEKDLERILDEHSYCLTAHP